LKEKGKEKAMNQAQEIQKNRLNELRWGGFIVMGVFVSMGMILRSMDKDLSFYFLAVLFALGLIGAVTWVFFEWQYRVLFGEKTKTKAKAEKKPAFEMEMPAVKTTAEENKKEVWFKMPSWLSWGKKKVATPADIYQAIETVIPSVVEQAPKEAKEKGAEDLGGFSPEDLREIENEIDKKKREKNGGGGGVVNFDGAKDENKDDKKKE
jgi:hypothetical protein